MVIFGCGGQKKLKGMEDASWLLQGFFLLVKTFVQSPTKKFVVLVHSKEASEKTDEGFGGIGGGRNARLILKRCPGVSVGPVSPDPCDRKKYRPWGFLCEVLWTKGVPWWRGFIVKKRSSLQRGA